MSADLVAAAHYRAKGEVLDLSRQQYVECDNRNSACSGGWFVNSLNYAKTYGLTTEDSYSYTSGWFSTYGTCKNPLPAAATRLKSWTQLGSNDEVALLAALENGPIAVAVTVDSSWFGYSTGVLSSSGCAGPVNHAVLVVGAGMDDATGIPYWLVRNSWGTTWGEGGYARLRRGAGSGSPGMCNVAAYPFQATSAVCG